MIRNVSKGTEVKTLRPLVRKNQIPEEILSNPELAAAVAVLPSNYNFEIHKCIWKIKQIFSGRSVVVALQMPEGLLMYACVIADILQRFTGCSPIIMGDVTYGACCVDDFTAEKLGAEYLIHYGHSCLVPINVTKLPTLYVFVEISFDVSHLCRVIRDNFKAEDNIVCMGTIQFTNMASSAVEILRASDFPLIHMAQAKPLSSGETLGCTSPILPPSTSALVFVADGRFHLESVMIQNPNVPAFRYDPYSKIMTKESYDMELMKSVRLSSVQQAKHAEVFGLILGTLGRQGSPGIFKRLKALLRGQGRIVVPFLMAEINPSKLKMIPKVQVWVQVACPRLSIDWSGAYDRPILTPYELEVALGGAEWQETYPMDYYRADGGSWSSIQNR